MLFSSRFGYKDSNIQYECVNVTLKKKIMAVFYKQEFDPYDTRNWNNYTTGIEDMMIAMGVTYDFPRDIIIKKKNAEVLQQFIINAEEWYIIYDFIEKYIKMLNSPNDKKMEKLFNDILEEELSGYRIVDGIVVPITTEEEIETVIGASNTRFDTVNIHIKKAKELFSDRRKPDYENSIKESISAVEAICCIVTESKNGTLGETIKKLKENGVHIHQAMEKAFTHLYGYSSDESGIRHGKITFYNSPVEDARYMLITCSAFVNYLVEKLKKMDYENCNG